jgi:hypothetical protein
VAHDTEEEVIAECFKRDKEGKTKNMGKAIIPVVTLRHTFQIVDEEGRWNGKIDVELKVGEVGSERGGGEDYGVMGRGKEDEREKIERSGVFEKEKKRVNIILHSVKELVDEDDDGVGDIYFLFRHGSNRIESKRVKGSGEAIFEDGM